MAELWKLEMASVGRLRSCFDEHYLQLRQNKRRTNVPRRGLLASVQQRILLGFGEVSNDRLVPVLASQIHLLESEWYFVRTFLYYVDYWADVKKVVPELESTISKIAAAADPIAENLMKYGKRYSKLIDVICESQKKIELLKPDIGEVVNCLIKRKGELQSSSCDFFFWERLLNILRRNLDTIKKMVDPILQRQISDCEYKLWFEMFMTRFGFFDNRLVLEFVDFTGYAASVIILMAEECCLYWFRKMDVNDAKSTIIGLWNLLEKIHPTNPECLDLMLKLLKSAKEISPSRDRDQVDMFLRYLLHPEQFGIHEDLKSLVTYVINTPQESIEDVESCLSDIKAVLREAGSLVNSLMRVSKDVHFKVLAKIRLVKAKIWLLNMEIFLKEQLISSINCKRSMVQQSESFNEGLQSILSLFSKDVPEEKTEYGKQTLTLIEEVAREVTSLCKSFHAKKIRKHSFKVSLFVVLLKILLFKSESFLMELLNGSASLAVPEKGQIETLCEGLKLLMAFAANESSDKNANDVKLNQICTHIEAVSRRVIYLYYSFLDSSEELIKKIELLFSDLQDKIKLTKVKLREICPKVPRSSFPMTNRFGFPDSLLTNLEELQNCRADSIAAVKHQIEEIHRDIDFLRSFIVSNIVEQDTEHQALEDLGKHVSDVAYEVEYVIDSIEVGSGAKWQHLLWLYDLMEEIKLTKMQATKIHEQRTCVRINNVIQTASYMISQASTLEIDEVVVGLSDQEEVVIDQLTRGSSQRDIVSIVGMPGIGKTTLAKKVYNNSQVAYHFHIQAWCCVSQVYSKRELLLDILSGTGGLTDSIHLMSDGDLDLELYQQLKQRRYLIVMDDMWNTNAWDDLERSFPDDGNGSRILMTSRLHDISLKARPKNDPHSVRLLTDDESWELLQMKIFQEEGCPEELFEVGKKIAQCCKGLPLAVVAVAGLLKRMDKKQDCWKQTFETLSARIIDDPQTRCMDILELSYKDLPDNLKACFLYFGSFLVDREIPVCRLICLWIAEGFIHKTEVKSLEDLGEDYLMDLIGRSLVIVAKRRSLGGVKTCRVHDILHDLCLSKAKEDNFLQPITRYDEPYASFDDSDYGSNFDYYYPSKSVTYERHRLCIYLERKHFVKSTPSGSWTRSLMFSATSDRYPRCPYDVTFISHNFKLLRVLDLECINMGMSFPVGIELLIQLRFLAVSGDIDSIPSSIANLWKLETFLVKGLKDKVVLPDTLWTMARLRHVHVNSHVVFSLQDGELGNSSQLDHLLTLSTPAFSCGQQTEKIIMKFPNLRKLRCIYLESWNYSKNCNEFPRLDILTQLESLNVLYYGKSLNPESFSLPVTLKKLTLSNFRLPWIHASAIGRLQNLEVLKLLSRAFEGRRWDMREGEFLKLKFLKLDTLNVVQWNATSDHFPNLQRLVLQSCKELVEVPSDLAEIPTLQMIEVHHCGESSVESARRIEQEGIEGLKVLISH